ncbi:MAG: hypothetical protein ACXADY_06310 [Candidatus Hodarchaeales archaeon]
MELQTPLGSQEFIKLQGFEVHHQMDSFGDELNDDRFIRKITNLTRKLRKTVLGRNMKKFKPIFLHQNYYAVIDQLITKG